MLEKIVSKLKKNLLFLSIPLITSCLGPGYVNEVYQSEEKQNFQAKVDTVKKNPFYDFEKSAYSSSLGWDFDYDGIINYEDIWPHIYGPYVDMNGNGIVDIYDWQISGNGNFLIDSWASYFHYRWIGNTPTPWRSRYFYNYFDFSISGGQEKDFVYGRRKSNTTTNYDVIRKENNFNDEEAIQRTRILERRISTDNKSEGKIDENERKRSIESMPMRRSDSGNSTSIRRQNDLDVYRKENVTPSNTRTKEDINSPSIRRSPSSPNLNNRNNSENSNSMNNKNNSNSTNNRKSSVNSNSSNEVRKR